MNISILVGMKNKIYRDLLANIVPGANVAGVVSAGPQI